MKNINYLIVFILCVFTFTGYTQCGGLNIRNLNARDKVVVGTEPTKQTEITDQYITLAPLTQDEINALTPQPGSIVYDTDSDIVRFYNGSEWKRIGGLSTTTPDPPAPEFCPETVVYEGRTYHTVEIGEQCWMKENLNVGIQINSVNNQTNNGGDNVIEKWCYDNNSSNCDVYGGLYQWNEIMSYNTSEGSRGICPEGWHIPTESEFLLLKESCGGTWGDPGDKLKEGGTDHWKEGNTGTNESGFTAFGTGSRQAVNNTFEFINATTGFWTSTIPDGDVNAYYYNLHYLLSSFNKANRGNNFGLSIRCLRDSLN